jgi:hypothetical protein
MRARTALGLPLALALVACGQGDAGEATAGSAGAAPTAAPTASEAPVAPVSAAEVGWPEGLYSDVRMSEESGDLGGFEVRFYLENGVHLAEFVRCEGWCNASYESVVSRDGQGFAIEHVELLTGDKATEAHQVRYRLTPVDGGLRLEGWYDGQSMEFWGKDTPLRPIAHPFGLDVANHTGE